MERDQSPGSDRPASATLTRDFDLLRLIVDRTTDFAVAAFDREGRVTCWNPGAERMHGYRADEVVGQRLSQLYLPEDVERQAPEQLLEIAACEGRVEHEGWRVRKDGTRLWVNTVITALRDHDGQLFGFGEIARDLTERRREEQRLRESEERLRLILESTVDYAIFMLEPSGHVASWNTGAQRIKGYEADEIIGRHFSEFYPPDAVERGWPQQELAEATRLGRFEDEGWRVRKDGTRFWANVIITPLRGPDGVLRGFAKVTRDLTQRKAHEERIANLTHELEQRVADLHEVNRELAQRNVENETFVYSVSHDLRSPLVNLQGFSQELTTTSDSLKEMLARPAVPAEIHSQAKTLTIELEESIAFIRNAVKQLGNIIDGLLRLSRVGRVEYESKPVDVGAVVYDILSAMHTSVLRSGARIATGPLPNVMGDRNAIGQVFANIIGNALKSFDDDREGVIEISADATAVPPVFSIRDNGVGIPVEYQPKIFQVFQHVHRGRGRGEGMGLAIVRRIVERLGGRIWFESAPGVGTTFFFTLGPLAAAGQTVAEER